MADGNRIEALAMGQLDSEVKETIRHLENGAGHVAGCPGHEWIARGVVLCLKLLQMQIRGTATTQKHLFASGLACFMAVLVTKLLELWGK
jgi:hypothetical protein